MSHTTDVLILRQILMRIQNGLSQRQTAADMGISRKLVARYCHRLQEQAQSVEVLLDLDDQLLWKRMAGTPGKDIPVAGKGGPRRDKLLGQRDYYQNELNRPGVTMQLLWEEYQKTEDGNEPYSYTSFCRLLRCAPKESVKSFHKEYEPGETLMIDFAGDRLCYVDKSTGERVKCPVLVASMGYSNYTYAEAIPNGTIPYLIAALNHCLRYIQAVPLFVLTDNMAQVVTRSDRYEPTLNTTALNWANHYGTMWQTARVRHPQDKSGIERHVQIIYNRIYAPLRDRTFYSLKELNEAVAEKLELHNDKNFQGRSYSRRDQFMLEELPKLRPLPSEAFTLKRYAEAKVQKNYHVLLGEDKHFYSVPFHLAGQQVHISYTIDTVEIYHQMERVAVHKREQGSYKYSTTENHMPEGHREYARSRGYRGSDFLEMAAKVGPLTHTYVERMLADRPYEQHAYAGCLGVLRLGHQEKYGPQRLEKACGIGLELMRYSYKTILTLLTTNVDKREAENDDVEQPGTGEHENLRGPEAFNS